MRNLAVIIPIIWELPFAELIVCSAMTNLRLYPGTMHEYKTVIIRQSIIDAYPSSVADIFYIIVEYLIFAPRYFGEVVEVCIIGDFFSEVEPYLFGYIFHL